MVKTQKKSKNQSVEKIPEPEMENVVKESMSPKSKIEFVASGSQNTTYNSVTHFHNLESRLYTDSSLKPL